MDERRQRQWVDAALETLGIDRLVLIVFDAMLPRERQYDVGTGSPYSASARQFFEFVKELGFNGLQFGPQGAVSRGFPSPYDSTAFSRNPLAIAIEQLPQLEGWAPPPSQLEEGLLPEASLERAIAERPATAQQRVAHTYAFDQQRKILDEVAQRLIRRERGQPESPLARRFRCFCSDHEHWLLADGLYDVVRQLHGAGDFEEFTTSASRDARLWTANWRSLARTNEASLLGHALEPGCTERITQLSRQHAEALERYRWVQFLVHEQHQDLHRWAAKRQLELYGDLHVGYSRRDLWHYQSVFLADYRLGAPPSRTNPEGQPWGCPVLDPELYFEPDGSLGPALRLLSLRATKLFAEYDRMRIDHPHGLVCPWVYRHSTGDDVAAVQAGARLFTSPALADHPQLARFALARTEDLDTTQARHADGWLRHVAPEQLRKFARCFDVLAKEAQRLGSVDRLACEVLSTQPTELGAVLSSYGLGRFRVTQKANVEDPTDVYLSDNAKPEDWMLLGNHDTPPIWHVVERWRQQGTLPKQIDYLAKRLSSDEATRQRLTGEFQASKTALIHGKFADLFISDARNVIVSFSDLFGFDKPYNVPGTVTDDNWSQRLPLEFANSYEVQRRAGTALDLSVALRMALQKRAPGSELLQRS